MAAGRDKRQTAGNRMTQLLQAEDEDDFYKSTYGGFEDVVGDDEYKSEEEESDEVDTDFSIDEDDEPVSGQDDDEPKRKISKVFVSRAYKEPKKSCAQKEVKEIKTKSKAPEVQLDVSFEKKSIRKSTKEKSAATEQRQRERETQPSKRRPLTEYHNFTQEELLREAKITEQKNLKSLDAYRRLELERKKTRVIKHTYIGPMIRFHSVSMPLIEELPPDICVDDDSKDGIPVPEPLMTDESLPVELVIETTTSKDLMPAAERCARNFVTFTDERLFRKYFPVNRPVPQQRSVCPITRMTARYFDPVTQMAYSNLQAFKVLREAYYQQLEQKGDRKQPEVALWMDWRKKLKAQQQPTQALTVKPAAARPLATTGAPSSVLTV